MDGSRPLGQVYLIHLARPLAHARHVLGWAEDLEARIEQHRATTWEPCEPYLTARGRTARGITRGLGIPLLGAANTLGIEWTVVRTWPGDKTLENRLRKLRHDPLLCPVCNPTGWQRRGLLVSRNGHAPETGDQEDIPF